MGNEADQSVPAVTIEHSSHLPGLPRNLIPFYVPSTGHLVEWAYLNQVLFARVGEICGSCSVIWKPVEDAASEFAQFISESEAGNSNAEPLFPAFIVFFGVSSDASRDLKLWRENGAMSKLAKRGGIAIHLSDEGVSHNTAWYGMFAAVYRSYWPGKGRATLRFLQSALEKAGLPVPEEVAPGLPRWFPLGFTSNLFIPATIRVPLSQRRLLFIFVGDIAGKSARTQLIDSLASCKGFFKGNGS